MADHIRVAHTWLTGLAHLCPPTSAAPMTPDRKNTLAVSLAGEFPVGAFTQASAEAVATGQTHFPAVDLIRTALGTWWGKNRPQADEAPEVAGLPASERVMYRGWYRDYGSRKARQLEMIAAGSHPDDPLLPLAKAASMMRRYAPAAWRLITGSRPLVEATRESGQRAIASAVEAIGAEAGASLRLPASPRSTPVADQVAAVPPPAPPPRALPPPSPEVLRQRAENPVVQAALGQQVKPGSLFE